MFHRLTNRALIPLQTLTRELDHMFEGLAEQSKEPPVSVWEDAEGFHLYAEVPGLAVEDIDISVLGNRVTLKGERKPISRENATQHHNEWRAFQFERSFELPVELDGRNIQAELDQGILRVTLPKAPGHKPTKVKIVSAKT